MLTRLNQSGRLLSFSYFIPYSDIVSCGWREALLAFDDPKRPEAGNLFGQAGVVDHLNDL